MTYQPHQKSEQGMTLLELLIVMAISGILLGAVGLFVIRGFAIPREQAEQGAIVAEAQLHMERLSDTLRNARTQSGEDWIEAAGPCSISVRTNVDTDTDSELVTYTLDDATDILTRRVDGGASTTVARSVRNACETTQPVFTYYSLGGGRALQLKASPPALAEIDRIVLRLVIDVSPQKPDAVTLETVVTPREGEAL